MRKRLSALFVLFLLLFCTSSISMAAKSGKCGDNLTWTLDEETKTLTISGTGEMYDDYRFYDNGVTTSDYNTLKFKNGITHIGNGSFSRSNISSLVLPNSVKTIGTSAFYNCESLKTVTFGKELKTIGSFAFFECNMITELKFPDKLAEIGTKAVAHCHSLKTVTFGKETKTIGASAFLSCQKLSKIIVPSDNNYLTVSDDILFNKEKTTLILCPRTKPGTITVPSGVKKLSDSAFDHCNKIETVILPESITTVNQFAFYVARKLKSIVFTGDAPTFKNNSINDITVTIYYPKDNTTWTSDFRKSISDMFRNNITWKAHQGISENTITAKNIEKTVSADKATYKIGATAKSKAKLTYESDNKSITVNAKGTLTVAKNYIGTATITIASAETDDYLPTSKNITVSILPSAKVEFVKEPRKIVDKDLGSLIYFELKQSTGNPDCRIQVSTASDFKDKSIVVDTTQKYDVSYKLLANGKSIKTGKTYYIRIMWTKKGLSSGKWTTCKGKIKL